jgi:hypothetical protein
MSSEALVARHCGLSIVIPTGIAKRERNPEQITIAVFSAGNSSKGI